MQTKTFLALTVLLTLLNTQETPEDKKPVVDTEQLHKDFEALDRDGDGYLTAHDLRLSVPGIDENDITSFFDKFDGDRDGVLTFEEYLNIINEYDQEDKNQNKQDNVDKGQDMPNTEY